MYEESQSILKDSASPGLDDIRRTNGAMGKPTLSASANLEFDKVTVDFEQIDLDERYIAAELQAKIQSLHIANLVFLKAPKGTGKTKWLASYLKSLPPKTSILQIGHRQSLATVLSNALDLKCYLDDRKPSHRYSISLDSLDLAKHCQAYDVLIFDEIEQVFRHWIGDTTKDKRGIIFKLLVHFIRNAKQIICMDADMTSELACHLISKLRSNFEQDRVVAVKNVWKTKQQISVFQDKYHLIAEMIVAVSEGKRVYVPVGKRNLANCLEVLFKYVRRPNNEPVEVLLLTGDTNQEARHKAFFENPNAEIVKYDVLISTSTLSTGVSIDVQRFDAVYGLFDMDIYTYQDCDQAISRVRKCDSVNVWIHPGKRIKLLSEEEMREGPATKEMETRSLTLPNSDGSLNEGEALYLDMVTRIKWCEQKWMVNRTNQFIDLKEGEGWTVLTVPVDAAMKKAGADLLKIGRDPQGDRKFRLTLDAPNLSQDDLEELESKTDTELSAPQKQSLKKWRIAQFFRLEGPADVTMKHVQAFDDGDSRDMIRSVKLLQASRIDVVERDRYERENKHSTAAFTEFDHRTIKRQIFDGVRKASGIDVNDVWRRALLFKKIEDEFEESKAQHKLGSRAFRAASKARNEKLKKNDLSVTDEKIDRVAQYVSHNLETVNLYLKTNFKMPTTSEARVKVFNATMGRLGVGVKKRRRMHEGTTFHEYFVDYQRVVEYAASREVSEFLF